MFVQFVCFCLYGSMGATSKVNKYTHSNIMQMSFQLIFCYNILSDKNSIMRIRYSEARRFVVVRRTWPAYIQRKLYKALISISKNKKKYIDIKSMDIYYLGIYCFVAMYIIVLMVFDQNYISQFL